MSLAKSAVDRRKQLSDQRPVIQIDALAAVGGDDGQVFFHIMHVQLFGQHRTAGAEDVQTAVDYVDEHKEANGYYYSNLGLVLLGSDVKGYNLMIKMGND